MRPRNILKRMALPTLVLLMVFCLGSINGVNPSDEQQQWRPFRIVTTDDAALTSATRAWSYVNATDNAIFLPVPKGWTWVRFSVIGYGDGDGAGSPASGTFNYRAFAVRKYASAELVCTGTMNVGLLAASHLPYGSGATLGDPTSYLWVEGPPTCTDYWSTGASADGTTNDVGSVSFSTLGSFAVGFEVTGMTSLTSVYVLMTGGQ